MRNEDFDITVTVTTEGTTRQYVVSDTVHAAEILLRRWPDDMRGQKYRAALKACMDVMEGRKQVASARRAFVNAARQAHILVRTGVH
jgi:hypothetical protein